MIFLSHNYKDKDIVESIAVRLKESIILANNLYDEKNSEILPLNKRKILEWK